MITIKDINQNFVCHCCPDGMASSYIIRTLSNIISKQTGVVSKSDVYYLDTSNVHDNIKEILNEIRDDSNTAIFIADLPYIGEHDVTDKIDELHKKNGISVYYIDHHASNEPQLYSKYDWADSAQKPNRCSTMHLFLALCNMFSKYKNVDFYTYLVKDLGVDTKSEKYDYVTSEFIKLSDSQKFNDLTTFLSKLIGIDNQKNNLINLTELDDCMSQFIDLVWNINLVDHGKKNQLKGLVEAMELYESTTCMAGFEAKGMTQREKCEIIYEAAVSVYPYISNPMVYVDLINEKLNENKEKTKYEQRKEFAINSMLFYRVFDGNRWYRLGITSSNSDFRYDIENSWRNISELFIKRKENLKDIDILANVTSFCTGDTIFACRPVVKRKRRINGIKIKRESGKTILIRDGKYYTSKKDSFIDLRNIRLNKKIAVVPQGFSITYDNELYEKINELMNETISNQTDLSVDTSEKVKLENQLDIIYSKILKEIYERVERVYILNKWDAVRKYKVITNTEFLGRIQKHSEAFQVNRGSI